MFTGLSVFSGVPTESRHPPCAVGLFLPRFVLHNARSLELSYFHTVPDEASDPELLKLGTDKSLFDDAGFLPFAQKYRDSEDAFFEDYKKVRDCCVGSPTHVRGWFTLLVHCGGPKLMHFSQLIF